MKLRVKRSGGISSGCPELDAMIGGGFEFGTICHVYGKDGTGKTTLAMQAALRTMNQGHEVVWFDMNQSFDFTRMMELNNGNTEIVSKFKLLTPRDYEQQLRMFESLPNLISKATKMLVFDPVTYFYRLYKNVRTEFKLERAFFNKQLPILGRLVLQYDIIIVLVNQVRGSFSDGYKAVMENEINKFSKYALRIENNQKQENLRDISVKKLFKKNPETKITLLLSKNGFGSLFNAGH